MFQGASSCKQFTCVFDWLFPPPPIFTKEAFLYVTCVLGDGGAAVDPGYGKRQIQMSSTGQMGRLLLTSAVLQSLEKSVEASHELKWR